MTFTPQGGQATDYTAYVQCQSIVPGKSLLKIDQFVTFDQYNNQINAFATLLAGLSIPGGGAATPTPLASTVSTRTPNLFGTPTPRSTSVGPAGQSTTVTLVDASTQTVVGLAVVTPDPSDPSKTDVRLLIGGVPAGTIALIHKGSCANLNPAPAFLLRGFDATGASQTTVPIAYADLTAGGYALALHATMGDLSHALACGDITGATNQ